MTIEIYSGYIADGYTEEGYIKEVPGIHQPVRFAYRPVTHDERARIFEGWTALPAHQRVLRTSLALSKKILSWDLQFDGKTVPCSDANTYKQLKTLLHNRLLDIVCGTTASDLDLAA